jgi:hypothetical protein
VLVPDDAELVSLPTTGVLSCRASDYVAATRRRSAESWHTVTAPELLPLLPSFYESGTDELTTELMQWLDDADSGSRRRQGAAAYCPHCSDSRRRSDRLRCRT